MLPTAIRCVLRHAASRPDAVALIDGADVVTYGKLAGLVGGVAEALRSRGIAQGDRVLLHASSTLDFVVAYLASHAIRAIAVPLDVAMPEGRRSYIAERVSARLVLAGQDQLSMAAAAREAHRSGDPEPAISSPAPEPSDAADILFTSGTTGAPKGVVLTHANLAAAAHQINAFVGTRQDDVEVLPLTLGHSFGLGGLRCALSAGAASVLVDGFAFPGRIYEALEKHAATGFRCVAAGLAMMLRAAPDRLSDFAGRIRYVELGSAPMAPAHKQRLMELLPRTRICMHYGLTEATRSAFIEFHEDRHRLHSVGRPSDGVEIRVVGDDGTPAAAGFQGEIRIRGAHVAHGYWEEPERTREALVDGWLRTGDLGSADTAGYLYLHGRKADIINVGGRKVAPTEVEDALRSHPAVLDCGCSGIDDPAGVSGEAVAIVVLLRERMQATRGELRDYLRGRLEPYKLPVKWVFSGTIPRTTNGKVQRHLLRDILQNHAE